MLPEEAEEELFVGTLCESVPSFVAPIANEPFAIGGRRRRQRRGRTVVRTTPTAASIGALGRTSAGGGAMAGL